MKMHGLRANNPGGIMNGYIRSIISKTNNFYILRDALINNSLGVALNFGIGSNQIDGHRCISMCISAYWMKDEGLDFCVDSGIP